MSSLLTNSSAMTALQTLSMVNKDLSTTQSRISTGQKVATASDNAAYWSIATTMRSDNSALGAVQDALGLGASKVDTAYAGMDQAIEYVKQIKDKLIAAQEPSADRAKLQGDISQLQDQLKGIAESTSFSGENWLQADLTSGGSTQSVVSSFVRDSSGNVSVKKIDYSLDSNTVLFDTRTSGAKAGILDAETSIDESGYQMNVNDDGAVTKYTLKTYSTADIVGTLGSDLAFDTNGSVAFDGSATLAAGDSGYLKVDEDKWVKVSVWDDAGGDTQEIAYKDTNNVQWKIDTTDVVSATGLKASVTSVSIDSTTTSDQLDKMLQMVDSAYGKMTSAAASLGSISSRIDMQSSFISKLTDSLDRGIGRLVDADMEKESARLSALQVQQQLGIQSLSIANSNSQNILSLFR